MSSPDFKPSPSTHYITIADRPVAQSAPSVLIWRDWNNSAFEVSFFFEQRIQLGK
jgi:hypothetical protein